MILPTANAAHLTHVQGLFGILQSRPPSAYASGNLHRILPQGPADVWVQELRLIPSTGPCASIFRGINPLISLMLIGNRLVYLSVPSPQYIQLYSLNSVAYTATPISIFSITLETLSN
jgi:hypothetical protein